MVLRGVFAFLMMVLSAMSGNFSEVSARKEIFFAKIYAEMEFVRKLFAWQLAVLAPKHPKPAPKIVCKINGIIPKKIKNNQNFVYE